MYTCADMIRGNATLQTSFAGLQVAPSVPRSAPEQQNGHANGFKKVYVIEALLDLAVVPPPTISFEVRMAACECIKAYFYKHPEVRHHFLNRAIEGHASGQDETANVISMLLREEMKGTDPYRVWFAADLVFNLIWEDPKAKDLLMVVSEGDPESGEEVVTCIQTISSHLITALQRDEDERIPIAYFTVLSAWLFESPSAVNDFLGEGSNVQTLKQALATTPGGQDNPVIMGLAAVLLGLIYEFSTKDSPIPRRKLQPLLTAQLGRERYLQALSHLRQHPLIRDFEVSPSATASTTDLLPPYAFFDATFVDFLKDNFSRLSRAIDRDPGLEVAVSHREDGIDRDLVDSLRAELDDKAQTIRKLEGELLDAQRERDNEIAGARKAIDTAAADVARIKSINESLQKSSASEIEALKSSHASAHSALELSKRTEILDLKTQLAAHGKTSIDEAARTKEYYDRQIAQLRAQKTNLETRLEEASKKEASFREMSNKSQQALRQGVEELTSARKAKVELETRILAREKEIENLKRGEAELKEVLEDERTKISMLEKEAEGFEGRLKEVKGRAERDLEGKEEERRGVQTELDDLMMILGDLEEKRGKDKVCVSLSLSHLYMDANIGLIGETQGTWRTCF